MCINGMRIRQENNSWSITFTSLLIGVYSLNINISIFFFFFF